MALVTKMGGKVAKKYEVDVIHMVPPGAAGSGRPGLLAYDWTYLFDCHGEGENASPPAAAPCPWFSRRGRAGVKKNFADYQIGVPSGGTASAASGGGGCKSSTKGKPKEVATVPAPAVESESSSESSESSGSDSESESESDSPDDDQESASQSSAERGKAVRGAWRGHDGWSYRRGVGLVEWVYFAPDGREFHDEASALAYEEQEDDDEEEQEEEEQQQEDEEPAVESDSEPEPQTGEREKVEGEGNDDSEALAEASEALVAQRKAAGEVSSPFVGVRWDKSARRWRAEVPKANGGKESLGYFHSEDAAVRAIEQRKGVKAKNRDDALAKAEALAKASEAAVAQRKARGQASSQFVGVYWVAEKRQWRAEDQRKEGGGVLGYFRSEEAAAQALEQHKRANVQQRGPKQPGGGRPRKAVNAYDPGTEASRPQRKPDDSPYALARAALVDDLACEQCGKRNDAAQMILCDTCDRGYHIYCLTPPLQAIPKGDWSCASCLEPSPGSGGPSTVAAKYQGLVNFMRDNPRQPGYTRLELIAEDVCGTQDPRSSWWKNFDINCCAHVRKIAAPGTAGGKVVRYSYLPTAGGTDDAFRRKAANSVAKRAAAQAGGAVERNGNEGLGNGGSLIGVRVAKQFGRDWYPGTVIGYHKGDDGGRRWPEWRRVAFDDGTTLDVNIHTVEAESTVAPPPAIDDAAEEPEGQTFPTGWRTYGSAWLGKEIVRTFRGKDSTGTVASWQPAEVGRPPLWRVEYGDQSGDTEDLQEHELIAGRAQFEQHGAALSHAGDGRPWDILEDAKLARLVHELGPSDWATKAEEFATDLTADALQQRYELLERLSQERFGVGMVAERISVYNSAIGRSIGGFAAPRRANLEAYLAKNPDCRPSEELEKGQSGAALQSEEQHTDEDVPWTAMQDAELAALCSERGVKSKGWVAKAETMSVRRGPDALRDRYQKLQKAAKKKETNMLDERVPMWHTIDQRLLSGGNAPKRCNVVDFLRTHPDYEIHTDQGADQPAAASDAAAWPRACPDCGMMVANGAGWAAHQGSASCIAKRNADQSSSEEEDDDADEYAAALPQKTAPFGDSTLQSVPVVRLGLDASEDDDSADEWESEEEDEEPRMPEREWLASVAVGSLVQASDQRTGSRAGWFPAKITAINEQGQLKVHYVGWSQKYDWWAERSSQFLQQRRSNRSAEVHPDSDEEEGIYDIEKVVKARFNKLRDRTEYQVRWVGYEPSDDTWEPFENLGSNADELVAEFEARKEVPKPWTANEDAELTRLVQRYGKDAWSELVLSTGRTADAMRDRWVELEARALEDAPKSSQKPLETSMYGRKRTSVELFSYAPQRAAKAAKKNLNPGAAAAKRAKEAKQPGQRAAAKSGEQKKSSLYVGVSLQASTGRWAATLQIKGKKRYLGLFDEETDAARAYDAAVRDVRGDKKHGGRVVLGRNTHLNFPTENDIGASASSGAGPTVATAEQDEDSWVQCEACAKWRRLPVHISTSELPERFDCTQQTWLDHTARNCEQPEDGVLEWVQCDACSKWRTLPSHISIDDLPERFVCSLSTWVEKERANCDAPEEGGDAEEEEADMTDDPGESRAVWTPDEEDELMRLQSTLGSKWPEIATHLPGRTDSNCRERFHELQNAKAESEVLGLLSSLLENHGRAEQGGTEQEGGGENAALSALGSRVRQRQVPEPVASPPRKAARVEASSGVESEAAGARVEAAASAVRAALADEEVEGEARRPKLVLRRPAGGDAPAAGAQRRERASWGLG